MLGCFETGFFNHQGTLGITLHRLLNIKSCRPPAELVNACRTSADKSADSNIIRPFYAKTVDRLVNESILNCLRLNCYGLSNIPSQFSH